MTLKNNNYNSNFGFPEEETTPSVASILFEIREQKRIGTAYKYRYSQTGDEMERRGFVRKWREVQESKQELKSVCPMVWMKEEYLKRKKRREEAEERREAERRREEERRRKEEEERKREEERRRKMKRGGDPWWVRAAMIQIPPPYDFFDEDGPFDVTMDDQDSVDSVGFIGLDNYDDDFDLFFPGHYKNDYSAMRNPHNTHNNNNNNNNYGNNLNHNYNPNQKPYQHQYQHQHQHQHQHHHPQHHHHHQYTASPTRSTL